jgi:hypothetical protein
MTQEEYNQLIMFNILMESVDISNYNYITTDSNGNTAGWKEKPHFNEGDSGDLPDEHRYWSHIGGNTAWTLLFKMSCIPPNGGQFCIINLEQFVENNK